ncbi:MAG: hypothetical protein KBC95_02820 [Candidatus Peribacteraceae bacterium]|nr:hypothetical protein [Candidatus Peribacteraceae bacterium]
MSQPLLVSANLAQEAVESVLPAIRYAISHKIVVRPNAHIVVGNPAYQRRPNLTFDTWSADGGILYEMPVGEPDEPGLILTPIARIKAYMAWRDQMSTREMISLRPDLIRPGDVRHAGGVVEHDWAVGISGFQAELDEAYARMILSMGWALFHRGNGINPTKGHFCEKQPD